MSWITIKIHIDFFRKNHSVLLVGEVETNAKYIETTKKRLTKYGAGSEDYFIHGSTRKKLDFKMLMIHLGGKKISVLVIDADGAACKDINTLMPLLEEGTILIVDVTEALRNFWIECVREDYIATISGNTNVKSFRKAVQIFRSNEKWI